MKNKKDIVPILPNLGIKSFRSFDDKGIYLENLKKVNFLIGKNNVGKSNVLRFLKILGQNGDGINTFPNDHQNQHNGQQIASSIVVDFSLSELKFPPSFRMGGSPNRAPLPLGNILKNIARLEYRLGKNEFNIFFKTLDGSNSIPWRDDIGFEFINYHQITAAVNDPWDTIRAYYQDFFERYLKAVAKQIIYIPDIRFILEGNNINRSNSVTNGSNLISTLSKMINYDEGEDEFYEQLKGIEKQVAELLGIKDLKFQVPDRPKKDKLILSIENARYGLDNLGSGIQEMVLICCILMLNKKSIVCLEEPELHLHPELQRRFIRFLLKTEHQYLITTHSSVFLDQLNPEISIYHVSSNGLSSSVSKTLTNQKSKLILNDLGYKASDLLQANGIIWVEGPSDRTYINTWIELLDPTIVEGIHYTIMFYGGKLLSYLGFNQEESLENEFIEVMQINRNAFVVMDKDRLTINQTKTRIQEEVGISNTWITEGKEVENYLTLEVINKWLAGKGYNKISEPIDSMASVSDSIVNCNPKLRYEKKKAIYAPEIAEYLTIEDIISSSGLRENIDRLVKTIKMWNQLEAFVEQTSI